MLKRKPTPNESFACQRHLLPYLQYIHEGLTDSPFIAAPYHTRLCDALEDVVSGLISRLIVSMPPRSGKTDIFIRGFISWCLGLRPQSVFLNTSYGAELAIANAYDARLWMQSEAYGCIFGPPSFSSDAVANYKTTAGGAVYSAGSDGALTGFGGGQMAEGWGGAILIDDPLKPQDANSKIKREGVNKWFLSTLQSRKNNPQTPIILTMQRLHVNDLAGFLLAGGNGETWTEIKIPALNENDETFWEHMPADGLKTLRAADPRMFASQYQQSPVVAGGNLIKGDWFKRYSVLPAQFQYRFIVADTAMKTGEANDYSVLQCYGVQGGALYLLDQVRGRFEAPELERRVIDFWAKHAAEDSFIMGGLRQLHIEDKASGTGLIQALRQKTGLPISPVEVVKDKYTRVCDVLGYLESGRVHIPEFVPWVNDFLSECEAFTADDSHDHDDMVDCLVMGINLGLTSQNVVDLWSRII